MSVTTTAQKLINGAFDVLGVKAAGETVASADANDALRRLNAMIDGWGLQPGTMLDQTREVFDLVANKGGPDNPYLVGPSATTGNFSTVRPVYLQGVSLLLTNLSVDVEVPLSPYTEAAYMALAVKSLTSVQPTGYHWSATSPFASLYLWPVPDNGTNDLVLYSLAAVSQFADLVTLVTLAPGYAEAIEYNLALRLAAPYGATVDPDVRRQAGQALAWVKTGNSRIADLSIDVALTQGAQPPWNILAGP